MSNNKEQSLSALEDDDPFEMLVDATSLQYVEYDDEELERV